MTALSDKTILIRDRGLFVGFAIAMTRYFGRVLYNVPNESAFPTPHLSVIGDGFDKIEVVKDLWPWVVEADCIAFPDVGMVGMQKYCRYWDKPVWGSGEASKLELNRIYFKERQEALGMKVRPYKVIRGVNNLRVFLDDMPEAYVKISKYRGLTETYHHDDMAKTELWLENLTAQLGPLRDHLNFIVEEPIDAVVETGLDTFCVRGKYPKVAVQGIEAKDKGYIGTVTPWVELPKQLTTIASQLTPDLGDYANFLSLEVRITENGDAFLTDPSCRHASPAGECLLELIGNLGEVVWGGAHGELVEPEYTAKYSMQAIVDHPEDKMEWRAARIPQEVGDWFKPYFACRIDGATYFVPVPTKGFETAGSVVATGDTLDDCLETLKERASLLEEAGLVVHTTSLAEVLESIKEEEKAGVPFTDGAVPDGKDVIGGS